MTVKLFPPNAFISSGYQTLRLDRSYQGKDQHTVLLDYMLRLFFLGPHGFKWLKRTGWVVENCPFIRPHRRPKTRPIQAKVYGNYILKNSLDFHTSIPPCCSVIYSFFPSFSFYSFFLSLPLGFWKNEKKNSYEWMNVLVRLPLSWGRQYLISTQPPLTTPSLSFSLPLPLTYSFSPPNVLYK